MFKFSKKQRLNFLKRFGDSVEINNKKTLAIPERVTNSEDGQVSETLYITADSEDVKQEYEVKMDGYLYRIAYINNDNSGLVNCYLSVISTISESSNGRARKYK